MIILLCGFNIQGSYFAIKNFWLEGVAQIAQFVIGTSQGYKNIFGLPNSS